MQSPSLSPSPNPWLVRLVTFVLAALAAASVAYWVLKWSAPTSPARQAPIELAPTSIDSAKVARLLGANPNAAAPVPVSNALSKYKLVGVIAQGGHSGSALIAIDGQTAKPFRVGESVADQLVLQSVTARSAALGAAPDGSTSLTLELPPLPGSP